MKMLFVLIGLFNLGYSYAQEHTFLTPMGAYEGIAGNTGIGRNGSVGSVIYNPAGLASFKSSKISASGSAFSQNTIKLKAEYLDEEVKYIQTTPSQITTVFNQDSFNWAFSILVPKSDEFDYAVESGTPSVDKENLDGYSKIQETLFGPSIGFKFSNSFRMGLSLFASKRDEKQRTIEYYDYSSESRMDYFQSDASSLALFPVLGLLITPSRLFSMGIKFSGPSTQLSGEVESKYRQVYWNTDGNGLCGVNDPCSLAWNSNEVKEKTKYEKPMELGIGFSIRQTENLKVLFDVTNQFKKEYKVYKEDASGESYSLNYKNVLRYNLGFEYLTSQTDALTLGFMYNPDPLKDRDLDFMGATFGYRSLDKLADSSVGIFYNQAKEKSGGVETKYQIVGLFISSSINFLN